MAMANPLLAQTISLAKFDFPQWKIQIYQQASVSKILPLLRLNDETYDVEEDPYLALTPPEIPQAPQGGVSTRQSSQASLDVEFQSQMMLYQAQNDRYEKQVAAGAALLRTITTTIPQPIRKEIERCVTPAEAYHGVLAHMELLRPQIVVQLDAEWHQLLNTASSYTPIDWTDKVVVLYRRLKEIDPTALRYAKEQFLKAIQIWDPMFHVHYDLAPEVEFLTVAKNFKHVLATKQAVQNYTDLHSHTGSHAVETPAPQSQHLQQQTPSNGRNDGRRDGRGRGGRYTNTNTNTKNDGTKKQAQNCACQPPRYPHTLKDCQYLNPDQRPHGFRMHPQALRHLHEAYNDPRRRQGIERAIGHAWPDDIKPPAAQNTTQGSYHVAPQPSQYPQYQQSQAPASYMAPSSIGQSTPSAPRSPYPQLDPFRPPTIPPSTQGTPSEFFNTGAGGVPLNPSQSGHQSHAIHLLPELQRVLDATEDEPIDQCFHVSTATSQCSTLQEPQYSAPPIHQSVPHVILSTQITGDLAYRDWWIFDTGSGRHFTNRRDYYTDYYELAPDQQFTVGFGVNGRATAIGYGSIPLKMTRPDGSPITVLVHNIYLIPGFMTNIISAHVLEEMYGLYYSAYTCTLHDAEGTQYLQLEKAYQQRIIAKSVDSTLITPDPTITIAATSSYDVPKPLPATTEIWHARLGHPGPEILKHLAATTDAKILSGPQTSGGACDTCIQAKMKANISRAPSRIGRRPMDRIDFDYVTLPLASNGCLYMLHFYDTHSTYHTVYPLINRDAATIQPIVHGVVKWCQNLGFSVRHMHSDNDTAFKGLDQALQHQGIEFTQSTAYNHSQLGFAERAGGVITQVARALHIHAGLPDHLWPWTTSAAVFLLNRRPNARLQWHAAVSVIQGSPANLAPLRVIGCKAYVLRKQIPRRDKLSSRVWIGYLVGIQAINIWHVWNPATNRVRTVRDVIFDEHILYKDTLVDVPQLQQHVPEDEAIIQAHELTPTEINQLSLPLPLHRDPRLPPSNVAPSQPAYHTPPPDVQLLITPPETPAIACNHISIPSAVLNEPNVISFFIDTQRQFKLPEIHAAQQNSDPASFHILGTPTIKPPTSWRQLATHPHQKHYFMAIQNEITKLESRNTWVPIRKELVKPSQQVLPLKWVFTDKPDQHGQPVYKARLVVRGDLQRDHISRDDLYAHTAAMKTFRTLIAVCAARGFKIHQLDAIQAFLQSKFEADEHYYIHLPPGYTAEHGDTLRLLRPLYGLRGAPRAWYNHVRTKLLSIGARPIPEDPCLWRYQDGYIFFYVDDFLIATPPQSLDATKLDVMALFEMHDLGLANHFLGIQINATTDGSITLNQDEYINKLMTEFDISPARKPPNTPIRVPASELMASHEGVKSTELILLLQRLVGSLLYLSLNTRPDIAQSVHMLARHIVNPSQIHITAAKQIIQYVNHWRQHRIRYSRHATNTNTTTEIALYGATDASFADDIPSRHSTEGYVIFLHGGPISWAVRRQSTVSTSTTEAELTSLSHGIQELIALRRLITQMDALPPGPVPVYCDNVTAVKITNNHTSFCATKLRHIDIQQHWLRHTLRKGGQHQDLQVKWVSTQDMPADGLTKLLNASGQTKFVKLLRLIP
jgi:hypothetical protein